MGLSDYIGKFWAGAEVMYGIIITMTFTSMLRAFPDAPGILVGRMIHAALLCCIAWGLADGFFYLWERNYILRRENRILDLSRSAEGSGPALSLVGEELDDTILKTIDEKDRMHLYGNLIRFLSGVNERERLHPRDAATIILGTLLLSAAAGLIVVCPFFFIPDVRQALILSNIAGIALLFCVGYLRAFDRDFLQRMLLGFGSSLVGIIIAGITVIMGG